MKVAIVGCGNVSKNHFLALNKLDDIEIIATVDTKAERAQLKAKDYGAKAYTNFDEMLAKENPDCIHIATPHYLHTDMAIKALSKGINVFLEKPCSVNLDEINALIEADKKSNAQLGVCFQNRYNKSAVLMKEIIDSGKLGKMIAIRAFVTWNRGTDYYGDDWHGTKDKECGGVLINQSIHTMDLVQYFCGGCKSVTAHVFNDHLQGFIEVEDTGVIRMEMANGVIGLFYATTAYGTNSEVFIEAEMEKGTLRIESEKLTKINPDGTFEILCNRSQEEFVGKDYWGHSHSKIINDFYDCIKTGKKFALDSIEGSNAVKIILYSYESSEKNMRIEVK